MDTEIRITKWAIEFFENDLLLYVKKISKNAVIEAIDKAGKTTPSLGTKVATIAKIIQPISRQIFAQIITVFLADDEFLKK